MGIILVARFDLSGLQGTLTRLMRFDWTRSSLIIHEFYILYIYIYIYIRIKV